MQLCQLDHLTVTARTLEEGAAYVKAQLGVDMQPGGQHVRMGTHNLLLRLGDASFLEVISPDPTLTRPNRPRWFALDDEDRIAKPRLSTWVARTSDLTAALQALGPEIDPLVLGPVEPMSRGALNWLITIPEDGQLPMGGVLPTLIQWHTEDHPATKLRDAGLRLAGLTLFHPAARTLGQGLKRLGLDDVAVAEPCPEGGSPFLRVQIRTPDGIRTLGEPSE